MTDKLRDKLEALLENPPIKDTDGNDVLADAILDLLRGSITLEWGGGAEGFWFSTTPFGQYQIRESEISGTYLQWDGFIMEVLEVDVSSADAAKAAALEHYRSTIFSALGGVEG